jgi:putative glutathione S-transferase
MPNYSGEYTLPILYDKKLGKIVNNDCYEISAMFNKEFHCLALNKTVDLFPSILSDKIQQNYDYFNKNLLKKVYEAGLSNSQEEYESAYDAVYESIEKVDKML